MREPWPQQVEGLVGQWRYGKDKAVGGEVVDLTQQASDLDAVVVGGVPAVHVREHGIRTAVVRSCEVGPERSRYRECCVGQGAQQGEIDRGFTIVPDLDEPASVCDPALALEADGPQHEPVGGEAKVTAQLTLGWRPRRAHHGDATT